MLKNYEDLKIYTDGAYSSSVNIGGIGFIIIDTEGRICRYSKPFQNTTNQRMEQMAIIMALESITKPKNIVLYTDSLYIVGSYTQGWKRNRNLDLWNRLDKAVNFHLKVEFIHVEGHSTNEYNCMCDELARSAVNRIKLTNNTN